MLAVCVTLFVSTQAKVGLLWRASARELKSLDLMTAVSNCSADLHICSASSFTKTYSSAAMYQQQCAPHAVTTRDSCQLCNMALCHSSMQLQLQQDKAKDRDVVLKEVEQLWRLFHKTWQRNHGCLLLLLSLCISATVVWAMSKSVRLPLTLCNNGIYLLYDRGGQALQCGMSW